MFIVLFVHVAGRLLLRAAALVLLAVLLIAMPFALLTAKPPGEAWHAPGGRGTPHPRAARAMLVVILFVLIVVGIGGCGDAG